MLFDSEYTADTFSSHWKCAMILHTSTQQDWPHLRGLSDRTDSLTASLYYSVFCILTDGEENVTLQTDAGQRKQCLFCQHLLSTHQQTITI